MLVRAGRDGWSFLANGVAIAAVVAGIFVGIHPDVLPALDPAHSLTTTIAASSPYTLTVMTWVAGFFTPVVIAYQAWSYWVFRRRIGTQHIPVAVGAH